MKLDYKKSGVDYSAMDPWKILAQKAGKKTSKNILNSSLKEITQSRGEPAYIVEYKDAYFVLVEECLGTKSLVADATRKITGKTYYDLLAQDSIAYIVNDLITVGARPVSIAAYWAMGSSKWCKDQIRMKDLVNGWARACDMAGATWGGGETPVLSGIIKEDAIDIAGAGFGIIKPKSHLILGNNLKSGDTIILIESRGIQSNGVSLARKIAERLPGGYATILENRSMYGEALLEPTIIYSKLVQALIENKIDIHYMSNITGHGWRKLMRAKNNLSYEITDIGKVPEIFKFIQEQSNLSDKEMYATFNMGAGFALYVAENDAEKALAISKKHNIKAWVAGKLKKGPKQVIIKPLNIFYKEKELEIR